MTAPKAKPAPNKVVAALKKANALSSAWKTSARMTQIVEAAEEDEPVVSPVDARPLAPVKAQQTVEINDNAYASFFFAHTTHVWPSVLGSRCTSPGWVCSRHSLPTT